MRVSPQPFTQDAISELLKESEDILSPLLKDALPTERPCPECQSKMICVVDPDNPFTPGKLLQNFILQCPACWTRVTP